MRCCSRIINPQRAGWLVLINILEIARQFDYVIQRFIWCRRIYLCIVDNVASVIEILTDEYHVIAQFYRMQWGKFDILLQPHVYGGNDEFAWRNQPCEQHHCF